MCHPQPRLDGSIWGQALSPVALIYKSLDAKKKWDAEVDLLRVINFHIQMKLVEARGETPCNETSAKPLNRHVVYIQNKKLLPCSSSQLQAGSQAGAFSNVRLQLTTPLDSSCQCGR